MLQISFIQYPAYTKELLLEEKSYLFTFVWNTRGEFWTVSIYDTSRNPIIEGIKLVLNYNLFKDYKHLNIPEGNLYVIDVTNNVSKIKYEDFTNERQLALIYEEVADLATV
jgi:hypothetical protein